MLKRWRSKAAGAYVPGSGVSIHEVRGRLLIRTIDGSDGPGIERSDSDVIDGYPDVDAELLGRTVIEAMDRARTVLRPSTSTERSEAWNRPSNPLVTSSPGTYRSFRAWQRVARRVSVARTGEGWTAEVWAAELSSGGWQPVSAQEAEEILAVQHRLSRNASPAEVGAMVLNLLTYPPVADG